MNLDEKGRCPNCLRKPLPYRREKMWFCARCCRQYSIETGKQQPNWAWEKAGWGDEWKPVYPDNGRHTYMNAKPTAAAVRAASR